MRTSCTLPILISAFFVRGLLAQANGPQSRSSDTVFVGLLDDAREEVLNWIPGVAKDRLVRPAFQWTSAGWRKIDYSLLPKRVTWAVAFDGKHIGNVSSEVPKVLPEQAESRVVSLTPYQFIVSPADKVPFVGEPAERFAPLAMGPTKGRRPLVVISKPYFADPDGWRRTQNLPPEVAALIRARFRKDFPRVNRCSGEKIIQRGWDFPDSVLSFPIAYQSNKDEYLVETSLAAGDCGYIDDPNDPLSDPWFFVSRERRVKRFGSFLYLLDTGDYDNDGRSELIFGLNLPEDTDGFLLYDAGLNELASLVWSYH